MKQSANSHQKSISEVDFDISATAKSKNVSFAAGTKGKQARAAARLNEIANEAVMGGVDDVKA